MEREAMSELETILAELGRQGHARWWVGPRPAGDGMAFFRSRRAIQADLARSRSCHRCAGTTSLAYGPYDPDQYWIDEAARALRWLGHDAIFLGNGFSNGAMAAGWNPLTCATFDSGVIGYDARTAFIFWVEDED